MARDIRLTPYDEQMIEPFDEDASGPEYTAYGSSVPSRATESYFPPEDSMPLFLSDDPEAPRPRRFGTGGESNRSGATVWPRILKAGILTASAAAIAFAIVSVENPLALFANAKASLIGTSSGQAGVPVKSASEPPAAARLASTEPPTPATQTTIGIRTSPPSATGAPTRDEIAAALRSAHQGQPEIRQPSPAAAPPARAEITTAYQSALQNRAPAAAAAAAALPVNAATRVAALPDAALPVARPPVAAPPPAPAAEGMIPRDAIHHLDPNEIASSLTRANALIASGDLAAARLVLRRPADSGDARAAMTLAETYDPAILEKLGVHGVVPDLAMARGWYEKAKQFGATEATQRLELLASKER